VGERPNILFFHVDNLGFGELSCYSGGPFRGTWTRRIDAFAGQGVSADQLRARGAVHADPVGVADRAARDPLREPQRAAGGPELYGVKWRNFKLAFVAQQYSTDPVGKLSSPRIINLVADPHEREPLDLPYMHSWTVTHFNQLLGEFQASIEREPPVPPAAPLDFVPSQTQQGTQQPGSR
jgi:hypothetical protein